MGFHIVYLDDMELAFAKLLGKERHDRSVARGGKDRWGDGHGYAEDMVGAAAEMAVCRWAGIYFEPTIDTFGERADILPDVQVRCRRVEPPKHPLSKRELFVRPHERDSDRYVLVTWEPVYPHDFVIRGWMYGREAKVKAWFHDHGRKDQPAFFVPHAALRDLAELVI